MDIGSKLWTVKSRWVERERKTDENGKIWEKIHPRERDHNPMEGRIVGKMKIQVEGENRWDDEPFYDQYAIKFDDGSMELIPTSDLEDGDWSFVPVFTTKEEAEEYAEEMNARHG